MAAGTSTAWPAMRSTAIGRPAARAVSKPAVRAAGIERGVAEPSTTAERPRCGRGWRLSVRRDVSSGRAARVRDVVSPRASPVRGAPSEMGACTNAPRSASSTRREVAGVSRDSTAADRGAGSNAAAVAGRVPEVPARVSATGAALPDWGAMRSAAFAAANPANAGSKARTMAVASSTRRPKRRVSCANAAAGPNASAVARQACGDSRRTRDSETGRRRVPSGVVGETRPRVAASRDDGRGVAWAVPAVGAVAASLGSAALEAAGRRLAARARDSARCCVPARAAAGAVRAARLGASTPGRPGRPGVRSVGVRAGRSPGAAVWGAAGAVTLAAR
jgi:hypothetical protein